MSLGAAFLNKAGAIKLTPVDALPETRNLRKLKQACVIRWGTVPLIEMLKEAALRTGALRALTGVGTRGNLPEDVLIERLLLIAYAYGTNSGLRTVASGDHAHSEEDLRYTARRYFTATGLKAAGVEIANATFAARQGWIWGESTTTVASDSSHFGAFDRKVFTEWHARYGGRGVLVYWHVERCTMAIHSQVLNCSASEVAAMIEGVMRHGTSMDIDGNYVDSHGQSEIGFAITSLLGFKLLARIKQINRVKLYGPDPDSKEHYPLLQPAMTRPIRWELIEQNYDMLVKYATAIRVGTATTEAILRRFTRNASHPVYQAMLELGRAQKTIFVCRYLHDRDLQREVNSGLNIIERLARRQRRHLLRQERRARQQPPRPARTRRALTPPPPSRPRLHQHPDDPRHPHRPGLGRAPHRRGQARPEPAVHLEHDPIRRSQGQHDQPARVLRSLATRPRPRCPRRLTGRSGGATLPLVTASLTAGLNRAIMRLSFDQHAALVLREFGGLTYEEVARGIGC